jgi:uncharacterized protein (TIGR03663 family)
MAVEYRETIQREGALAPCPFPRLTVEMALYVGLAVLALGVRLAALGRFPLSTSEASTALAAWRAARGGEWRPESYSPLLFDANLLLFWLARAGDGAARLVPALAGAALVALPYAVRRTVGRAAALVMATLLAFAPGWVFHARTNDWPIVAAALAAALLVAVDRYRQSGLAPDARLVALALGLGLAAGPGIITPLLAAGVYALLWARGHSLLGRARLRGLVLGAVTRENLLLVGGVFVAFGSALWVNPGGIGAAANLAWRWFGALPPEPSGPAWSALPVTLLTYEFLTVALAAVGAVAGLRRRDPLDQFLVAWAALALLLGSLLGHRGPEWLLDVLLPLVVLAGRGGAHLWEALRGDVTAADVVALVVALALGTFALLEIAAYLHTAQQPFLVYGLFVLGTLALAWAGFWLWGQPLQAARVGVTAIALLAVGLTVRATTAVAYQTGRDPREPLVGRAALPDVRDMEALVTLLSDRMTGDQRALDVAYERDLDPWLGWYLREYPAARGAAGLRSGATVLVMADAEGDPGPAGYVGQRFILAETWPQQALSIREYLRWFLYRAPVGEVERSYLHVWVQAAGVMPQALQRTGSTP